MKRFLIWVGLLGALGAGCAVAYYDPYYYDSGYYAPYYYGADGYLVYSMVDTYGSTYPYSSSQGQPLSIDLEATATGIADKAATAFAPAGCATATASGTSVSYRFANCQGHFGVGNLSGQTTLNLSQSPDGELVLATRSSDLVVDGKPSVVEFTATLTQASGRRVAAIASKTHLPGQVDVRETEGTITWDPNSGCIEVDGNGSSTRGALSVRSSLSSVRRCHNQCPKGGTIVIHGPEGEFQGHFDGSNSESVVDRNGKARSYTIQCQ